MTTVLVKVEGAGNDFLLGTGSWSDRLADDAALARSLCDRHRGIGADGVVALRRSGSAEVEIAYRNSDGGEAGFCANATRCAARVAVEILGLPERLTVVTGWTAVTAEVVGSEVALELPPPPSPVTRPAIETPSAVGPPILMTVGVPHLVLPTADLAALDLSVVAPPLRSHRGLGADGANVNFYELGDDGTIRIRSWERGIEGETLCCGSGVVAVALAVMAEHGSRSIAAIPASGDSIRVEALGQPPICPTRCTGPTRIVARVEPAPDLVLQDRDPRAG